MSDHTYTISACWPFNRGVQRDPVSEVSSWFHVTRVHLFAYCLNPCSTMHFTRFRQLSLNAALWQWRNRVKCTVLYVLNPQMNRTCMYSNVATNLSWTCLVSGPLNFEHSSVLLFCSLRCDETLHTAQGSMDTVLTTSLWHFNDLSPRSLRWIWEKYAIKFVITATLFYIFYARNMVPTPRKFFLTSPLL